MLTREQEEKLIEFALREIDEKPEPAFLDDHEFNRAFALGIAVVKDGVVADYEWAPWVLKAIEELKP